MSNTVIRDSFYTCGGAARIVVFPLQLAGAVIVFSLFLGTIATVYGLLLVRGE